MQRVVPQNKRRKGFTLVELIVVIAILAVLAAAAIAGYAGLTQNAAAAQAHSNAATIVTAVNNHNTIADDFHANAALQSIPPELADEDNPDVLTWDISIGSNGAPTGTGYKNQTASGPVDLTIKVSMTGPEWKAAEAYIDIIGNTWIVKDMA